MKTLITRSRGGRAEDTEATPAPTECTEWGRVGHRRRGGGERSQLSNGLSRTLRDVRLLRDRLLADDDWGRAAAAYAADHDDFYGRLHRLESMMADLYLEMGPAADQRRRRAFALFAQDETRSPDTVGLGPEAPSDETARRRFFGEV